MTTETTTAVPDGLTLTANWYARKAHYAPTSTMRPYSASGIRKGQFGTALCGYNVYDQDFQDTFDRNKRIVVAYLPLCKLCSRAAAKFGGGS